VHGDVITRYYWSKKGSFQRGYQDVAGSRSPLLEEFGRMS
jgi:hypothetical protein